MRDGKASTVPFVLGMNATGVALCVFINGNPRAFKKGCFESENGEYFLDRLAVKLLDMFGYIKFCFRRLTVYHSKCQFIT